MIGVAGLVLAVFVACAVEAVEAVTIVLAVGITRQWRSSWFGVGAATIALAAIIAALGPALVALPISVLRLVVGTLLLLFGLQWLRKAILRGAGYKALHDEDAIYATQVAAARAANPVTPFDGYAFTISFKAVLLEGLEVAFIVITFGANQGRLGLGAAAAAAAIIAVTTVALLARRPLARAPENTMKFVVGAMLCTYGMFWAAEGAGVQWPGKDLALIPLLVFTVVCAALATVALRARRTSVKGGAAA
jgi:uncharacterized membrane protein